MVTPTEVARGVDALADGTNAVRLASRANAASQKADGIVAAKTTAMTKEQKAAASALQADDVAHRASITDKVITAGSMISGIGGLLAFMGPGALKIVAWPFKKTGEWTGMKLPTTISNAIRKPADYFTKVTVSDFGRDLKIDGIAGKGSQAIANGAATVVDKANGTFGLSDRFIGSNLGKGESHLIRARRHAAKINTSELHPDLKGPLERLQTQIKSAESIGHLHTKAAAGQNIQSTVSEIEGVMATIAGTKGAKIASEKNTLKAVNGLVNESGHVVSRLNAADAWRAPGKAVKEMPAGLAKSNLSHVTVNGLFIAGSLFSGFQDLKSYFNERKSLKGMRADGVSEEAISMAKKGSLKKLALKQAGDIINIGINVVQAVNHKFSMGKAVVGMGSAELLSRFADNLTENKIEPAYETFKRNYLAAKASGQELPAEHYAAYIEDISKDLKVAGGAKNPHVQEVAKQLAEAKLDPAQVLNEATNGRLSQRLYNIIDANKAAAQPVANHSVSNVDKVRGHNPRKDMPVVGPHTQNVVNESAQPSGIVRT